MDEMHAYLTGALLAHLLSNDIEAMPVMEDDGFTFSENIDISLPTRTVGHVVIVRIAIKALS